MNCLFGNSILGQVSMHVLERKEQLTIKHEYLESIISMNSTMCLIENWLLFL